MAHYREIYKEVGRFATFAPWAVAVTPDTLENIDSSLSDYRDPATIMPKRLSYGSPTRASKRQRVTPRYRYGRRRYRRRRVLSIRARKRRTWRRISDRRKIGERIGSAPSKTRAIQNSNPLTISSRDLGFFELIYMSRGNQRNTRDENKINLRGIRSEIEFRNQEEKPCVVHFAWVSPKEGWSDGLNPGAFAMSTEFFRSYGTDRAMNFSDTMTSVEMNNTPINTDRFIVLKHVKHMLAGVSNPTQAGDGPYDDSMRDSFKAVKYYIPVKRQIRFENHTNQMPIDGQIFFVYWVDQFSVNGGNLGTSGVVQMLYRHVIYFRDPKRG